MESVMAHYTFIRDRRDDEKEKRQKLGAAPTKEKSRAVSQALPSLPRTVPGSCDGGGRL